MSILPQFKKYRVVIIGLRETVKLEQRHKGSENISLVDILGEHFRQKKQPQQRTLSQKRLVCLRKNTRGISKEESDMK